jgi:hypothetical protein
MFERVNSIIMVAFIAIGVLLMVLTMSSGLTPEQSDCTDCGAVGYFIGLSYFLLFGAIIAALGGAALQVVINPKQIKGAAIGIGGLLVVLVISYVLADGTIEPYYQSGVTETAVKLSGMGLFALYILFIAAVLTIAYSSVSRFLK